MINEGTDGNIYLITEYYPNGSLGDEVCRLNSSGGTKGLPPWQVRFYFLDMLKAIHYCHNVIGVVHRDIKPENIMVGQNREAVLIDFGLSTVFDIRDEDMNYLRLKAGTYKFFAPELFAAGGDVASVPVRLAFLDESFRWNSQAFDWKIQSDTSG